MKRFKSKCTNSIENVDTIIEFELEDKPKKVPIYKTVWRHFHEFTENTSLHGLKYIGERKRPLFERIWWIFVFLLSIVMCVIVIYKVWYKWQISPVIVSFAESSTPIWQIPFSAVTICNESKSKQKIFNFTDIYLKYKNDTIEKEESRKLINMFLICNFMTLYDRNLTTNGSSIDFIKEVAPQIDDMFMACEINKRGQLCTDIFHPIITEDGLCYTFNMLDFDDFYTDVVSPNFNISKFNYDGDTWTLDGGYKNKYLNAYPRRVKSVGQFVGLKLILQSHKSDIDYLCRGPVEGYKVTLHNPAEIPRVNHDFYRIPLDQEVLIAVRPNMMTTSEGLRSYSTAKRKCFFPEDRQLYYYKVYTQNSCDLECLTNYTLDMCGCVSFYMPQNGTTPICALGSHSCTERAERAMTMKEMEENLDLTHDAPKNLSTFLSKLTATKDLNCNCLPACTTLEYMGETSQANFNWKEFFRSYEEYEADLQNMHFTHLTIFFYNNQIITSKRSELYGVTDFLANCGGLLGLFMGFSFLSLVEIIYFCSVRIIGDRKKKNKKILCCK